MSSLGTYLRELREARHGTLDDIARSTRVGKSHLEALEADDFAALPDAVFVKGFIRAYCESLGVPPDEALSRYRTILGEPIHGTHPVTAPLPGASWSTGPVFVSLVLLVVLGVGLFAVNLLLRAQPRPPQQPLAPASRPEPADARPKVQSPTEPQPTEAPAPRAGRTSQGEAKPQAQRLVVKALESTWIQVKMDSGAVVQELLQPGAIREWTSERRFVLTVGNAAGIEVELNGQRMPPLGGRGAVINQLVLPRDAAAPGS